MFWFIWVICIAILVVLGFLYSYYSSEKLIDAGIKSMKKQAEEFILKSDIELATEILKKTLLLYPTKVISLNKQ